ncbi:adenylate/guanylate cyclase domain-containing protein [Methylomonas sp. SURF-2]|uniref:Adenylate/guanylate cyclase domain-containing protein n=1 Tax=Methylomonas subterranea TaxID=2952225 RepID=A0ABT1TG40_9GAMM|nr:adenylate/guanylate cyclase domain-containing protein [Methylomonas sp. SURF-2]MCQ8104420.1 adenylate/guanylate cyclase domain-containing protein [Methylomonas sp. SURF-2]
MPLKAGQFPAWLGFGVLLLSLLGGSGLYLWNPEPLQILRHAAFDQFQRLKPRPYSDTAVKIIDVDDESLKRLGQWPWPRTRLAELLTMLQAAEPASIAIDIIFAEKDRTSPRTMLEFWQLPADKAQWLANLPDHDQVLAEAVGHGNTALGFALSPNPSLGDVPAIKAQYALIGTSPLSYLLPFQGALSPLPALEAAAAGNGALTFISDADGVIRKVPLLLRYQNTLVPSLVAESLRLAQKTRNYTLHSLADDAGMAAIGIGRLQIPTTANGEIWIHYSQPDSRRYIPAWRILAGEIDSRRLRNNILLIGTSAQGLMDLRFSPLGGIIPGIEVHAQALEQILGGKHLSRPGWANALELLAILLGGLLIGAVALGNGAIFSFVGFILALLLLWGCAWWAYAYHQFLLDPVLPSIIWLMTFLFTSIFRHIYSERSQRWVKQAFSRYISPNLVEYLISHPEQLELGGRRQTCSFVFTDLVDFTALMERLDPGQAVSLLNTYLENMIAIAFSHHGTLDRIVGDAVAIMFSAPIQQTDHQRRAVQCALDMQRFASRYAAELNAQGLAFGQTRIGVHSGEVIVGNFGGKTIFDYRALGDVVNTASRLEGANKYLGTLICASEATLAGCPEIASRRIGHLRVKGKSIPLTVYELLDETNLNPAALTAYQTAHELMCATDPGAIGAFQHLVDDHPSDKLAAFHLKRLLDGESGDLIELSQK